MPHWRKALLLGVIFVAYFVVFGAVFGYHRLRDDFIPLDASTVGPNIYASFIWLPVAFLGGFIVSDVRNAKNLERQRQLFEAHAARIDKKLEEHHLKMASLLGVTDTTTGDALGATPGDRSLDTP